MKTIDTKPRDIVRFEQSDVGKQVKFSPHENETIYEDCLVGKVGVIKSVRDRAFDQELVIDFNYVLDPGNKFSIGPMWKVSGHNLVFL